MRSLGRSFGSRLRFNDSDETGDRIASFEQPGHLLDFFRLKSPFNDGGQEIQRLASEKVHGTERFQKHRCRSSHASFHYRIGHPFKQSRSSVVSTSAPDLVEKAWEISTRTLSHVSATDALEKEVITVWKGSQSRLASGIILRGQRRVNKCAASCARQARLLRQIDLAGLALLVALVQAIVHMCCPGNGSRARK